MRTKYKVAIGLALAAGIIGGYAVLTSPGYAPPPLMARPGDSSTSNNSSTNQSSSGPVTPETAAARVGEAPSSAASVDAAVDAIIGAYGDEQAVIAEDDADADYVASDTETINTMSEVYHEDEF